MNIRYPIYEGVYRILTDERGLYSEKVEIFNPAVVRHFRFVIFHFFRLNHNLSFLIKHDRLGKSQYFHFLYAPVCFLP